MDLDFWTRLLFVAISAVGSGLVAWGLTWIAYRLGKRRDSGGLLAIWRLCRHPFILTVSRPR